MHKAPVAILLAAGFGTRLKPLTDAWPKCLMPVHGRPLLEYWLDALRSAGVSRIIVNGHYKAEYVHTFIEHWDPGGLITFSYEPSLLGTAGTVRRHADALSERPVLLIHADNFTNVNLAELIDFHLYRRPKHCLMSMMTFDTSSPSTCGIVELDDHQVVVRFHEKVTNPPGTRANGAVYLLEPELVGWLYAQMNLNDFSTEVIPQHLGKIAAWHHHGVHRDIGSVAALQAAQRDAGHLADRKLSLDGWMHFEAFQEVSRQLLELKSLP